MPIDVLPGANKCVCGHDRRFHYADGPCLCAHKLDSGKLAEKTVCPCTTYKESP